MNRRFRFIKKYIKKKPREIAAFSFACCSGFRGYAVTFLRGLVDEVRTAIRQHNGYIYIPNLRENLETEVIN